jgi:hypothetical protein
MALSDDSPIHTSHMVQSTSSKSLPPLFLPGYKREQLGFSVDLLMKPKSILFRPGKLGSGSFGCVHNYSDCTAQITFPLLIQMPSSLRACTMKPAAPSGCMKASFVAIVDDEYRSVYEHS